MRHLERLDAVADSDTAVLRRKESTYQGSWKAAGGQSAWFMFRRNMDRLIKLMAPPAVISGFSLQDLDDCLQQSWAEGSGMLAGDCTLDVSIVQYLRDHYVSQDIFTKIEENPLGQDGTVLACLRDLRRYALLIEAEMVSQGMVQPEESEARWRGPSVLRGRAILVRPGQTYAHPNGLVYENTGSGDVWLDPVTIELMDSPRDKSVKKSLEGAIDKSPGFDLYHFASKLMGVDRDTAKRKCYQVLYGIDPPPGEFTLGSVTRMPEEDITVDLAQPGSDTSVEMRVLTDLEQKNVDGTFTGRLVPRDVPQRKLYGSDGTLLYMGHRYWHHAPEGNIIARAMEFHPNGEVTIDLGLAGHQVVKPETLSFLPPEVTGDQPSPWAVPGAWFQSSGLDDANKDRWWHQQAPDLFVLEAAVELADKYPPTQLHGLFLVRNGFAVVDIGRCPPAARDWFPRLRREVNTAERGMLPAWQRDLYRWDGDGTKWVLSDRNSAWVEK